MAAVFGQQRANSWFVAHSYGSCDIDWQLCLASCTPPLAFVMSPAFCVEFRVKYEDPPNKYLEWKGSNFLVNSSVRFLEDNSRLLGKL